MGIFTQALLFYKDVLGNERRGIAGSAGFAPGDTLTPAHLTLDTFGAFVNPATADLQNAGNATLAQIAASLGAQIDLATTLWTDNSGAYYVRRDELAEGTGAVTVTFTTPTGNPASPGAGLAPVATNKTLVTVQGLYDAVRSGAGYTSGDSILRFAIINQANIPPTVQASGWLNLTAGTGVATPLPADILEANRDVSITASVLPAGAATAAAQATAGASLVALQAATGGAGDAPAAPTLIGLLKQIGASLVSLVTASGSTAVTNLPAVQAVSAAALPLPAGAATAAAQAAEAAALAALQVAAGGAGDAAGANTLVGLLKQVMANGTSLVQAISATKSVAVTNLPATQPVSAATLPLPAGAATAAAQATASASLAALLVSAGAATDAAGAATLIGLLKAISASQTALAGASGSVSVTNLPATQAVSATALPLPAGAATEAGQAASATSLALIATAAGAAGDVAGSGTLMGLLRQLVAGTTLAPGSAAIGSVGVRYAGADVSPTNPLPVALDASNVTLTVSEGASFGVTQLGGPWTVSFAGQTVGVTSLPALAAGIAHIGEVSVSNFPAIQTVTWGNGLIVGVTSLPPLPVGGNTIGKVGLQVGGSDLAAANPLPTSTVKARVPYVGAGGTVTTGGQAQVVFTAASITSGAYVTNLSTTELLYLDPTGATASPTSIGAIPIAPGARYDFPAPPTSAVSLYGATTGHPFGAAYF